MEDQRATMRDFGKLIQSFFSMLLAIPTLDISHEDHLKVGLGVILLVTFH